MTRFSLISTFLFILTFQTAMPQDPDSVLFAAADSLAYNDTLPVADTLLPGQVVPDENLDDIFTATIDSAGKTWKIPNLPDNDSLEASLKYFPRNIPDSVYIQRLQDIEQVIDLSYNKVVRNFIEMYTEKKRDKVEVMLGLSEYYFPMFEEILDKYGLPLELKYLPVIESALNPRAYSRAGAMGLWQFMYGTAKVMKLEITSFVDERRDPVKSSDAAVRYLKRLYEIYNDWHLAIAAYNCGPGNVNRAIRRSGGKTNYWEIYYRLPRETRGYVPAFIAATYMMNYYQEHNLIPVKPEIPMDVDTIMINNYLHFDQLEATLKISKEELQALNPMYRRNVIPARPDKPYPLVLPNQKIYEFIDNDTTVFAWEREKYFPNNTLVKPAESTSGYFVPVDVKGKAKILYTVQTGDNVGYISSWFHVRANDLRYWNNIHRDMIRAGQKLAIYVPEKDKEKYEKVARMSFAEKQASIGKTVSNSSPSTVQVNKVTAEKSDNDYIYYTVKRGDSIWEIAKKYADVTSDEIMQLNNISNEKGLYVGQKLKIKKKS